MSEKIDHRRDTVPMKHETPLATFIREWCKNTNTTQHQLAQKSQIDRSMISRIANGERIPSRSIAMRLADAMGVPVSDMGMLVMGVDPNEIYEMVRTVVKQDIIAMLEEQA